MTTLTDRPARIRWARKCDACGFIINAGETYQYQRHIVDGYWYTSRLHLDCYAAIDPFYLDSRSKDETWSESGFIEWLEEHPTTQGAESILARVQ